MAEIRDEQPKENGFPDAQVGGGAQHEGFVEGEEEVQVGELREHDVGGERDCGGGGRRGGEVRHLQVGEGLEVGVEGADEGGDGLDDEEEECVCSGYDEGGGRLGHGVGGRCESARSKEWLRI